MCNHFIKLINHNSLFISFVVIFSLLTRWYWYLLRMKLYHLFVFILMLYTCHYIWKHTRDYNTIVKCKSGNQNITELVNSSNTLLSIENENSWMDTRNFILDSEACRIPDVFPLLQTDKESTKLKPPISCNMKTPMLTYIEKFVYVTINRSALVHYGTVKYCKYYQVYRPKVGNDNIFNISTDGIQFSDTAFVRFDFVMVKCFNTTNQTVYKYYHALIQPKYLSVKHRIASSKAKPNILMIGTDSVSRLNSLRFMPETRKILLHELKAFEMKALNKVADNTLVNMIPMLTGSFLHELNITDENKRDMPLMWKSFKRSGYRTLLAEDHPNIATFNYIGGFEQIPTDYYLRPFMLAINEEKGMWNQDHKCFMDKTENEIVLNWLLDYVRYYVSEQEPYFAYSFLTRLSHDTKNGAGDNDLFYANFLKSLIQEDLLDNTILFFFSDHGIRFGRRAHTSMSQFEARLPYFFIVPPKYMLTAEEYKNLKTNQNRLTTFFDIHSTLWHLINGTKDKQWKHGQSLLQEVPHGRSCQDASILPFWCACVRDNPNTFSKKDPIALEAAEQAVAYVNGLLGWHTNQCRKVMLNSIIDFTYIGDGFAFKNGHPGHIYRLTLTLDPGNVTYVVQIALDKKTNRPWCCDWQYIKRISKYNLESECVKNPFLEGYCYCFDFQPTPNEDDLHIH